MLNSRDVGSLVPHIRRQVGRAGGSIPEVVSGWPHRRGGGTPMESGPVQVLVIAFADNSFPDDVLHQLRRLCEGDVIRLLDVDFVTKDEAGNLTRTDIAALTPVESGWVGALVGALIGV